MELFLPGPSTQKDNQEMLQMMKDSIKSADSIVRALLAFSRDEELRIKPEDINSVLESSLVLIQHRVELKNIEIIKELKKDLPKVQADRGKIEQVFVNLFLNAIDAMPKSGKLYIRSYISQINELDVKVGKRDTDNLQIGEKIVISEIEDTGVGITKENIGKIFDPFFTTKNRAEGTGLGLSITKGIIEIHKGFIRVESERGKGTKFMIALKLAGGG